MLKVGDRGDAVSRRADRRHSLEVAWVSRHRMDLLTNDESNRHVYRMLKFSVKYKLLSTRYLFLQDEHEVSLKLLT